MSDDSLVNHPSHYNHTKVECIDVIEDFPFLEGNIIKYIWRRRFKGGLEDLKKAQWYLNRLVEKENAKPSE